MKVLGLLFLLAGLVLMGVAAYYYLLESESEVSPLPEEDGVKVIFVTPTGTK